MSIAAQIARLKRQIQMQPARRVDHASLAQKIAQAMDLCTRGEAYDVTLLPKWWTPLRTVPKQQELWASTKRFITVPAGRRGGKTLLGKRRIVRAAILPQKTDDAWYVIGAPTQMQAKRIFWKHIKRAVPPSMIDGKANESELTISLWNGARISVMGMDVPERAEGDGIDGLLLDEYGNMKEDAWPEHLRPALSDRQGWAWFIGVPEGRNHYYDLRCKALSDTTGMWANFTWTSEEILPPEEIAQAKMDLDDLTYQQEYLADFVTFQGMAYYTFKAEQNCRPLTYNPARDLILMFDFNVAPGVAVIGQESDNDVTNIIDEVYIPQNSNTPLVCRKIAEKWGKICKSESVYCYGDATGGARGSAKVQGSDWDLIKAELGPVFGSRLKFRVAKENPPERARVNSVNSRMRSSSGLIRLLIDPKQCPYTVKDVEGVRVIEGSAGEIDKKTDPKLTHLTDAVGYYIHAKHPIAGRHVIQSSSV